MRGYDGRFKDHGNNHNTLDNIARLVGVLSGTSMASVSGFDGTAVVSVGGFGTAPYSFQPKVKKGTGTHKLIENAQRDPFLANHPLVCADRSIRKVMWVPIHDDTGKLIGSLLSLNPKFTPQRTRNQVMARLLDLAQAIKSTVETTRHKMLWPEENSFNQANSFSEPKPAGLLHKTPESTEPLSSFLLETLVKRPQLRQRGDVGYTIVRQWRKPIKRYQIDALKALKANPAPAFVDQICVELAQGLQRQFGHSAIASVVPVPCGHSRKEDCLSVLIARRLAASIDAEFCNAFAPQPRQGASHPKQSARLRKFEFAETPKSPTIIVDDIVSSGRHIEQAVKQLRSKTDVISALVWLG